MIILQKKIFLFSFRYTYGKPVSGMLRMNISLETYSWSNDKLPTTEIERNVREIIIVDNLTIHIMRIRPIHSWIFIYAFCPFHLIQKSLYICGRFRCIILIIMQIFIPKLTE